MANLKDEALHKFEDTKVKISDLVNEAATKLNELKQMAAETMTKMKGDDQSQSSNSKSRIRILHLKRLRIRTKNQLRPITKMMLKRIRIRLINLGKTRPIKIKIINNHFMSKTTSFSFE